MDFAILEKLFSGSSFTHKKGKTVELRVLEAESSRLLMVRAEISLTGSCSSAEQTLSSGHFFQVSLKFLQAWKEDLEETFKRPEGFEKSLRRP